MIIVTGTSSGIGLEIAKFLLSKGQTVIGVSRRDTPISCPQFVHLKGDITDKSTVVKLANYDDIKGIVFNHGVLEPVAKIADANVDEWKKAMDINFFSIVQATELLLPKLRQSKAKVILVSSGAAVGHYPSWGSYGASKAALNHFTATLAVEEPELTAVSVAPGVVDTDMQVNIRNVHSEAMGKEVSKKFHDLHREGKLVSPITSGKLYGNLVLEADHSLSGKFLRFGDDLLSKYVD